MSNAQRIAPLHMGFLDWLGCPRGGCLEEYCLPLYKYDLRKFWVELLFVALFAGATAAASISTALLCGGNCQTGDDSRSARDRGIPEELGPIWAIYIAFLLLVLCPGFFCLKRWDAGRCCWQKKPEEEAEGGASEDANATVAAHIAPEIQLNVAVE